MPRPQRVLFSLKRKRIRASFNKLNVYNALTWNKNRTPNTQYRQVFLAKQETRSYHGEHLTETQFRNVFRSELTSVSPLQSKADRSATGEDAIPHALQTFVALERRLDTAVFRAMFAASTRQAAQFVIGGAVKVNGVKISQPGYVLRRGDMFSVDPNRVLEALGRPKPSVTEAISRTNKIIRKFNHYIDDCHKNPEKMWKLREGRRKRHTVFNSRYSAKNEARVDRHNSTVKKEMQSAINSVSPTSILESILKGDVLSASEQVTGKSKAVLGLVQAAFPSARFGTEAAKAVKAEPKAETKAAEPAEAEPVKAAESVETAETETVKAETAETAEAKTTEPAAPAAAAPAAEAETDFTTIAGRYFGKGTAPPSRSDVKKLVSDIVKERQEEIRKDYDGKLLAYNQPQPYDPTWVERLPAKVEEISPETSEEELANITVNLPFSTTGKLYGLSDPSKRWFTPWSPRQFISPMAVLPHHLEISFDTCHAVYLRDPVARPGHSEIISPFSLDFHERAHMWYFYRRRKNLPPVQ